MPKDASLCTGGKHIHTHTQVKSENSATPLSSLEPYVEVCQIKICFHIIYKCTLSMLYFSKCFQTHCIWMALSHLCRTPHPSIKYLVIPVDVFQLVLPQKDISQMKDTYVFLQKAGPSHLWLLASKTQPVKGGVFSTRAWDCLNSPRQGWFFSQKIKQTSFNK